MKLCIVGGGGFRVPLVYQALVSGVPLIDELWLYDTSATRLAVIESVLNQLRPPASPLSVHATTSLDKALADSDFVFSAMRVGGLAGRIADERVALDLGVIGQETTGPGGIAYALRTIPVAMRIAEQVRALAPAAYVVNFTNPAGIITEAMHQVLGDRVIGICDTPTGLASRLADAAGAPPEQVRLDYAGLNHLGWLRAAEFDGRDLVQEALASDAMLAQLEETQVFGASWLRTLGMLPNEYLFYYYFNRDSVRAISAGSATRGEFVRDQQERFYAHVAAHPDEALAAWDSTRAAREASYMQEARQDGESRPAVGGGYEYVALGLMRAIALDTRQTMILNVRNGDTLPGLPPEAVVEVPCQVTGAGAHPLTVSPPRGAELGLMQQVKAVEQLTIAAALGRDPALAVKALALHPLVDSVAVARQLLDAYQRAEPILFAAA